jgi:hypothetical protein
MKSVTTLKYHDVYSKYASRSDGFSAGSNPKPGDLAISALEPITAGVNEF